MWGHLRQGAGLWGACLPGEVPLRALQQGVYCTAISQMIFNEVCLCVSSVDIYLHAVGYSVTVCTGKSAGSWDCSLNCLWPPVINDSASTGRIVWQPHHHRVLVTSLARSHKVSLHPSLRAHTASPVRLCHSLILNCCCSPLPHRCHRPKRLHHPNPLRCVVSWCPSRAAVGAPPSRCCAPRTCAVTASATT